MYILFLFARELGNEMHVCIIIMEEGLNNFFWLHLPPVLSPLIQVQEGDYSEQRQLGGQ